MSTNLNELSKEIHESNVKMGWWNARDGKPPCIYEKLQLISTEVAEATEGERKGLMDEHLPHRIMAEVELADALIRTLDIGGRLGLRYLPSSYPIDPDLSKAGQHLEINIALCSLALRLKTIDSGEYSYLDRSYSILVDKILDCASLNGYDIYAAMEEKISYNAQRADHKLENRAKENGKKF